MKLSGEFQSGYGYKWLCRETACVEGAGYAEGHSVTLKGDVDAKFGEAKSLIKRNSLI